MRNPDKVKAASKKYYELQKLSGKRKEYKRVSELKRYGLTLDGYAVLLEKQKGRCAICKTDKPNGPGGRYFFVDHCHKENRVRGLLCCNCNFILGYAKDSTKTLLAAFDYLHYDGQKKAWYSRV